MASGECSSTFRFVKLLFGNNTIGSISGGDPAIVFNVSANVKSIAQVSVAKRAAFLTQVGVTCALSPLDADVYYILSKPEKPHVGNAIPVNTPDGEYNAVMVEIENFKQNMLSYAGRILGHMDTNRTVCLAGIFSKDTPTVHTKLNFDNEWQTRLIHTSPDVLVADYWNSFSRPGDHLFLAVLPVLASANAPRVVHDKHSISPVQVPQYCKEYDFTMRMVSVVSKNRSINKDQIFDMVNKVKTLDPEATDKEYLAELKALGVTIYYVGLVLNSPTQHLDDGRQEQTAPFISYVKKPGESALRVCRV